MKCPNCGYKNRRGVKFCENCGHEFSLVANSQETSGDFCANCGSKNEIGSRFCFKCGEALGGGTVGAPSSPQVVVINPERKKRNWFAILAILLLLLFGCALITSLVQVTPAIARNLPDFLQGPAMAFGRWQQDAELLNTIRRGANWVTTVWDDLFGRYPVAVQNEDQQVFEAPPENRAGACPDLSRIDLHPENAVMFEENKFIPSYMNFINVGWEDGGFSTQNLYSWTSLYHLTNGDTVNEICQTEIGSQLSCHFPFSNVQSMEEIKSVEILVDDSKLSSGTGNAIPDFIDCRATSWAVAQRVNTMGYVTVEVDLPNPLSQNTDQSEQESANAEVAVVGPPSLTVSQASMCRKGPGSEYDAIGDLQVGESTEIVARYGGGDYWVIENYGVGGTCWIYGGYAEISGDVNSLPYWDAPAPPEVAEPEPQETISWTFLNSDFDVCVISVRPSGGDWQELPFSGCISPYESYTFSMPDFGTTYDLSIYVCYSGGDCEYEFVGGVNISQGTSYQFYEH